MVDITKNEGKLKRRAVLAAVAQVFLFVAAAGGIGLTFRYGSRITALLASGVGVFLFWQVVRAVRRVARMRLRIVPYFDIKSGKPPVSREASNAFHGGFALAGQLGQLDDLARIAGVAPFSHLGFNDDMLGQAVVWIDPSEGLRTVSAVSAKLLEETTVAKSPLLWNDLQNLESVLKKAKEKNARFCLVLRYGPDDFISGLEMTKRQGSFWC